MKLEDLGIDPKNMRHDKRLTTIENRFLNILWTDFVGESNKISAEELAMRFDCAKEGIQFDPDQLAFLLRNFRRQPCFDIKKREVRRIYNHLLVCHDNIPILSKAGWGGGYWMSGSKQESANFYNTFRKRGMTGLVKAARGKKSILVDMMQQLSFEFEDLSMQIIGVDAREAADSNAAIAVVDSFLDRMLQNPERFSAGLQKLSKKYGSILLDKTQVQAMKAKASELSRLVEALG